MQQEPHDSQPESLVEQAKQGETRALECLVELLQGRVYNLALRMLAVPEDAQDAMQEILVKIITHLGDFRGDSTFMTWAYRIATNHLLSLAEQATRRITFERLGTGIADSLAHSSPDIAVEVERALLAEEVCRSCTLGMLQCLSREARIVVILGDLFEVSSEEGADILAITPAAFRKRLSRARAELVGFVSCQCGIVNPDNPCRCEKHINNKLRAGLIDPQRLRYATTHDRSSAEHYRLAQRQEFEAVLRTAALLRSHPHYAAPTDFVAVLRAWMTNPDSHLLENAPLTPLIRHSSLSGDTEGTANTRADDP
jgi:RNA polymerase sigma factor (sigma-70 family)